MISNNNRKNRTTFDTTVEPLKKMGLTLFSVATLAMPVHANEQATGFYAGFGIANISAEEMGQSSRENGLSLIGGYSFSKYFFRVSNRICRSGLGLKSIILSLL